MINTRTPKTKGHRERLEVMDMSTLVMVMVHRCTHMSKLIKLYILPKTTFRFKTIPIKITMSFFKELEQKIIRFV